MQIQPLLGFGTPSDKIWPGYSQMPWIKKPVCDLRFLTYNPAKRITCAEGLKHDYFYNEEPSPIDPAMFPTWPAKSENPHGGRTKKGVSPKPPSGGKNFKALFLKLNLWYKEMFGINLPTIPKFPPFPNSKTK
ncbi:hypothetical protein Avbf_14773 [Armadillidium vulgare]|nr:hypothetical protein Avbf_14773 [Armadillidium vulgare]